MSEKENNMKELLDRAAYLRGLAAGMGLDESRNENKLLMQLVGLVDELAKKLADLDGEVGELSEYVEDLDSDLADMEDALFDDECEGCEEEDCEGCHVHDEDLSCDCPHCGHTVMLKASDIDFEESPVCEKCGQPFFTDTEDDE